MLVALGDLKKWKCTFTLDGKGELRISFPDHSRIIDGKDGILILDGDGGSRKSDAERWLEIDQKKEIDAGLRGPA